MRLNVSFGYLSLLLGFLSTSEVVRTRIRFQFPDRTFEEILSAMDEFLHYHRLVPDEICQSGTRTDVQANFVRRLQSMLDRLRREVEPV